MQFHSVFIIIFLIFLAYMYIENRNNDIEYVVSSYDNNGYLVRKMDDKEDAANLLAKIRHNLVRLCGHLNNKYNREDGIVRLLYKFNPENIIETSKGSKYTSYSVNKGEKIVLCLRSRDNKEELVDENTLMFVSLHELAHIMTKSVGHTKEFWKNFKFLLKNAINLGVYTHIDYNSNPQKYCGITVTDTPLNDNSL